MPTLSPDQQKILDAIDVWKAVARQRLDGDPVAWPFPEISVLAGAIAETLRVVVNLGPVDPSDIDSVAALVCDLESRIIYGASSDESSHQQPADDPEGMFLWTDLADSLNISTDSLGRASARAGVPKPGRGVTRYLVTQSKATKLVEAVANMTNRKATKAGCRDWLDCHVKQTIRKQSANR